MAHKKHNKHNKHKSKNRCGTRSPPKQQQHAQATALEKRAADPVEQQLEQQTEQPKPESLVQPEHQQEQESQQIEHEPEVQQAEQLEPEHEKMQDTPESEQAQPQTQLEQQLQHDDEQLNQLEAQEPSESTTPAEPQVPEDAPMVEQAQEQAPEGMPMVEQEQAQVTAEHEQPERDDQAQAQEAHDAHHVERQQELAKLRAIESKVQQIHDKVATRLPLQRRHLAARVCGAVWAARARLARLARASAVSGGSDTLAPTAAVRQEQRQQAAQQMQQHIRQLAKKLRMELGAFDYQAKEQGELLTRQLCELDDILSFGDAEIKCARKALVVAIQRDALPLADALREQSARLKALGEALLATLPQPDEVAPATTASPADSASTPEQKPSAPSAPASEANETEMKPLFDDADSDAENDEENQDQADTRDVDNNEDYDGTDDGEDLGDDEYARQQRFACSTTPPSPPRQRLNHHHHHYNDPQPHAPHTHPAHYQQQPPAQQRDKKPAVDVQALPVWRPYYQLQKRRDGLYLVANLHDVEPANVHVQWLEHAGVLRISGYKLPTQKDLAMTRFSGVPTFGRFEIAERLPVDVLAMDDATQALRADGTLEIRMPYYVRPRPTPQPSLFTHGSLFDTPRGLFW